MTKPSSRFWAELTWPEFQALDPERTLAVLPMAATEQHGPHLPLSVDAAINRGILARALELIAADLPVLVLPPVAVGFSEEHTAFPGTLSLSAATLQSVCEDIGRSVHRAGLRKLVLFNSHGGQPQVAQIVARNLRSERAMLVTVAHSYTFEPAGLWSQEEQRHGIHGGASETSQIMHLRPDLVRRDKLARFASKAAEVEKTHRELRLEGAVSTGWQTQDLNPNGACGDATLANAEAGRTIIEQAATRLAVLLAEVSAYPLSKLNPGPGGR